MVASEHNHAGVKEQLSKDKSCSIFMTSCQFLTQTSWGFFLGGPHNHHTPQVVIFVSGRGIATCRALLESTADVVNLCVGFRRDVRVYYKVRAPPQRGGEVWEVGSAQLLVGKPPSALRYCMGHS